MKKMINKRIIALIAIMCMVIMGMAACGKPDGPAPEADTSEQQETPAATEDPGPASEPVEEARDPHEDYIGKWAVAAAESQGIMFGGNFGETLGLEKLPAIEFTDYENGKFYYGNDEGDQEVAFTWVLNGNGGADLKFEKEVEVLKSDATTVSFSEEDAAIFMDYEERDQKAVLIFTLDGIYQKAKTISLDGATPITSEDELIGKWVMIGMNMVGISMSGDAEAFKDEGTEVSLDFKEDGTVSVSGNDGTWKVDAGGATVTSTDVTGEHTYPILKQGDDIIMDSSEAFGGEAFYVLLEKE